MVFGVYVEQHLENGGGHLPVSGQKMVDAGTVTGQHGGLCRLILPLQHGLPLFGNHIHQPLERMQPRIAGSLEIAFVLLPPRTGKLRSEIEIISVGGREIGDNVAVLPRRPKYRFHHLDRPFAENTYVSFCRREDSNNACKKSI